MTARSSTKDRFDGFLGDFCPGAHDFDVFDEQVFELHIVEAGLLLDEDDEDVFDEVFDEDLDEELFDDDLLVDWVEDESDVRELDSLVVARDVVGGASDDAVFVALEVILASLKGSVRDGSVTDWVAVGSALVVKRLDSTEVSVTPTPDVTEEMAGSLPSVALRFGSDFGGNGGSGSIGSGSS